MALEDDDPDCSQSSVPLMSRRRVSLSSSSENVGDIEQGSVCPKSSLESSDSGAPGDSINVRVKTAGDGREYKVSSVLTATVAQFKEEVSRVIGAEGKYLRIIAAGKMLNPDDSLVKDFGLTENCYVHCVVTAAPPRLQLPSLTPEQAREEEEEDDDPSTRRGFDVLRNNGMTRGEVTAIRSYFSAEVRQFAEASQLAVASPAPDREGETDWDRQVEAEQRWMRAQPATSEFALNVSMARRGMARGDPLVGLDGTGPSGGRRDFIFGFAMGSFLGFIMLLWMWESAVPRRQKLGILAGVTFRQSLNMLQAALNSEADKDD